ncbi:Alpha/beta hydrolase fold-1 [Xylariaceae sp. FL1272]|nr:Alpha/beta hydrolase fold-1 [Xylariaceae sp. FL1272]
MDLSIVIIPAASALPLIYDTVVHGVSQHGYDIEALHIPSVALHSGARDGAPPTMYDDATFIADHVAQLADRGRGVLLVTHSYGGTPGTESIKGLTKAERKSRGKKGGVVGIAYITSIVPELGKPAGAQAGLPPSDGSQALWLIGSDGWLYYPNNTYTAQVVFSDIPLKEGEYWARKLVKHSATAFRGNLTYEGYKHVPVSYLIAEADHSIPPEAQRSQVAMIERVSGKRVDVSHVQSGHVPPITHPQAMIDYILHVARNLK